MQRLDTATADRWLTTVVPYWSYGYVLIGIWAVGLLAWMTTPDHSWLPLLAGLGAVLVQVDVPRFGCLLGVGCGVLTAVLEPVSVVWVAWIVLGAACLVLLLLHRLARTRQRALGLGNGLTVRVAFDDGVAGRIAFDRRKRVGIFTDDENQPRLVALLMVEAPRTTADLRRFAGRAVFVGELVEGARPDIVTPAGTLRAAGRLRARRGRGELFERLPVGEALDVRARIVLEVPSIPDVELPELPWTPRQTPRLVREDWLVLGGGCVSAGTVGIFGWLDNGTLRGFVLLPMLVALGPLIGLDHLCRLVVVDWEGLRISDLLLDRRIPWSLVKSIKRSPGQEVVIDLGSDRTLTLLFDGKRGRPSSQQVAGVLQTLRSRMCVPGVKSSKRPSWGAVVAMAYVAGLALVAYYLLTRF